MSVTDEAAVLLALVTGIADRLGELADRQACDATAVGEATLPALVEVLGARSGVIALRGDARSVRLVATVGMPESLTDPWIEFDVGAPMPIAAAIADGRPRWLADAEAARNDYVALPAGGSASLAVLPLRDGTRVIGALGLGWLAPHEFDPVERQTLQTVAALTGAALARQPVRDASALRRHVHSVGDGMTVACLARDGGATCTVAPGRDAADAAEAAGSVFATLLDADPALRRSTLERIAGVLDLCRHWQLPPALVGHAVSQLSVGLEGPITGAHVEIAPRSGWLALAPLDAAVVVAAAGDDAQGSAHAPVDGLLAGERVVVAGDAAAAALVLVLEPGTDETVAATIREVVDGVTRAAGTGDAVALVDALADGLHRTETAPCVRGALAVVVEPCPGLASRVRTLPAQPVASTLGRRFAVAALPDDADDEAEGDVALVTAELVSNAVRHAYERVELTVTDEVDGTRISVTDDDDRPPQWRAAARTSTSGRGLHLIDALSDERGVDPRPAGGKSVWVRLRWRRRSS